HFSFPPDLDRGQVPPSAGGHTNGPSRRHIFFSGGTLCARGYGSRAGSMTRHDHLARRFAAWLSVVVVVGCTSILDIDGKYVALTGTGGRTTRSPDASAGGTDSGRGESGGAGGSSTHASGGSESGGATTASGGVTGLGGTVAAGGEAGSSGGSTA